jgi:biopolymer transport protein ExbD
MANHPSDGEFGFQIAPMLDVLFVLLLFFMVTAGMQKRESALRFELPGNGPGPSDLVQVTLDVDAGGQVSFNGVPLDANGDPSLPETVARLKITLAGSPDRPVIIRPDPSVRQQRIVEVLDACRAAMARKVAFAAIP